MATVWYGDAIAYKQYFSFRHAQAAEFRHSTTLCKFYFEWKIFDKKNIIIFWIEQITRRYAEFLTSLLTINESLPNPKLTAILSQLQIEVQNFILRLASEFAQRKEQLISLINNYDLMLSVISVGHQASEILHNFSKLKKKLIMHHLRRESKRTIESPRIWKNCWAVE